MQEGQTNPTPQPNYPPPPAYPPQMGGYQEPEPRAKSNPLSGMGGMLIVLVAAGIIAYLLIQQFAPSLSQYKSDITRLELDLVDIRADYALKTDVTNPDLTSVNTKIASVETALNTAKTALNDSIAQLQAKDTALQSSINAIPNFDPTTLQASIAANLAAIDDLQEQLDTLQSDVDAIAAPDLSGINAAITALQTAVSNQAASITALTARVAALEAQPPPTTTQPPSTLTAAEAIDVTITQFGGNTTLAVPAGAGTTEYILALHYKNNANKQYTNVKYAVSFLVQNKVVASTDIILNSYGGTPIWYLANTTSPFLFQTYTGVTIAANGEGTLLLTLQVAYTGTNAGTIIPLVNIY